MQRVKGKIGQRRSAIAECLAAGIGSRHGPVLALALLWAMVCGGLADTTGADPPSQRCSIRVRPAPGLKDATRYTVTRGEEPVWSADLDVELEECVLVGGCDAIAGYAYARSDGDSGRQGRLQVVIIDSEGVARLDKSFTRKPSRVVDGRPRPFATAMVVNEATDQLILRVREEKRTSEVWYRFRVTTGEELEKFYPEKIAPVSAKRVLAVQAVPGLPLTVVQWYCQQEATGSRGTVFALIDEVGQLVWQLSLPDDFESTNPEVERRRFNRIVRSGGTLLQPDGPCRVVIRSVRTDERVTFAVGRRLDGDWLVSEVGREPYSGVSENGE